ncbi:MAG: winged helix-turn-helix domain-containing protein [Myxococcales bacterium]|nr:winged helix-turn-helix domain-containing protein [Myxococcales bacterium]
MDLGTGTVHSGGEVSARLSTRERALLAYMVEHPLRPIPREELLREVWGYSDQVVSRAADTTMRRLREKVEAVPDRPDHLLTEFGTGYRFVPPGTPAPEVAEVSVATPDGPLLRLRSCTVDLARRRISAGDEERPLTANESSVLRVLLRRRGAVVDRQTLLHEIWGRRTTNSRVLDAAVARLRSKIETDPSSPDHLVTQRGEGYRLVLAEDQLPDAYTLVVCGVPDALRLWSELPEHMPEATQRLQEALGAALSQHEGVAAEHDSSGFRFRFAAASQGLTYATSLQVSLRDASWPGALLEHPCGRVDPDRGHRGLRVSMAVVHGSAKQGLVHRADALLRACPAGVVRVDGATWERVPAEERGGWMAQAAEGWWDVLPHALAARLSTTPRPSLPMARTSFVGRRGVLRDLDAALAPGALVILLGPSGVGKTRLALEACRRPGTTWCDLVPARTADDLLETVALQLGVRLAPGSDPSGSTATLSRAWQQRGGPLVLDNVEQIPEVESVLERLWYSAPEQPLVVTTQRRPEIVGAHVIEVEPLSVAEASELFQHRAREVNRGFEADEAVLAQLAQRLDGSPLALELAAARCRVLSPAQLLDSLDRPSRPTGRGRHATVQDAVAWSWELLDDEGRRGLVQLASFVGPFDLESALAVLHGPEDPLWVLQSLRDHSLLQSASEGSDDVQLRLTRAVRAWCTEQRGALDPTEEARRRHAVWFAALPEQGRRFYTPMARRRLRRARADLREAMAWAIGAAEPELAGWAALGLLDIALFWGPHEPADAAVEPVLALEGLDASLRGQLWARRAAVRRIIGRRQASEGDLDAALQLGTAHDDATIELSVSAVRFRWCMNEHRNDEAVTWARRAEAAAERLGDSLQVVGYRARASAAARSPDTPQAMMAAIAAAREAGDVSGACHNHLFLAEYLRKVGQHLEAAPHLQAAQSLARTAHDAVAWARSQHGLALCLEVTDPPRAYLHWAEAEQAWDRIDSEHASANAAVGACHTAPDAERASRHGQRALGVGLSRGDEGLIARAHFALGDALDDRAQALAHLTSARTLVERNPPILSLGIVVYVALARWHLMAGETDQAADVVALARAATVDLPLVGLELHIAEALVAVAQGEAVDTAPLDQELRRLQVHALHRAGRAWTQLRGMLPEGD